MMDSIWREPQEVIPFLGALAAYVLLRNVILLGLGSYAGRRLLSAAFRLLATTYLIFLMYPVFVNDPCRFGGCFLGLLDVPPDWALYWDGEKTLRLLAGIAVLAAVIALGRLGSALWERHLRSRAS